MDQRPRKCQSRSLKLIPKIFFLIICLVSGLFSQNEINRVYRYNDAIVTFENSVQRPVLLMNIRNDSLLLLENRLQKWYSYKDLEQIQVQSHANPASANWAGFFSGIWLGNFIFYRAESHGNNSTNPTALMTRDYPEGIGMIAINAVFAIAGLGVASVFSPKMINTEYKFSSDNQQKFGDWQIFKSEMQFSARRLQKKLHLQINTGGLTNRVLNTYQEQMIDIEESRQASYFNVLRRIQAQYSIYDNIRIGFALVNQGEPTIIMENFPFNWPVQIDYDAVGYYGTIAYSINPKMSLTNFELVAGLGVGSGKSDLKFSESEHQIYSYSDSYASIMLFAELHAYLSDFFSICFGVDYCTSPSQLIPAIEEINLEEEKISFGNSSFGFGFSYHF